MTSEALPASAEPSPQGPRQPGESSALRKVTWFGIIRLAGLAVGLVVWLYLFRAAFSSLASLGPGSNPTPAQVSAALGPLFQGLVYIVPVTGAIELVAVVVLTSALRDLTKVDRDKFSIPSIFMIVLIAGIGVSGVGGISFLTSIPDLITRLPATPGGTLPTAFFSLLGSLVVDFVLAGVGGLLVLVGIIGGQILGLWRVGVRYNETVIKVGAIFSVIPILNIVAPILVLIGAHEARGQLV